MKLVDTHCHLYLEQFREDLDEVLERAAVSGVERIFLPGIDPGSLDQMEQLNHPEITFHPMVGIHPSSIREGFRLDEDWLYETASRQEIVALGETGLDYYWSRDWIGEQKKSLRVHCQIARDLGKPVVLHSRESNRDLLDLIESEQDGTLSGVWHCFTGSLEEGERALDLGLLLGIGGVITFRNAGVDRVVARLPLSKMVLETDAPYLAPHPNRGKRNEPAWIRHTAEKLAELLEIPVEEVARITTANAARLFRVEDPGP